MVVLDSSSKGTQGLPIETAEEEGGHEQGRETGFDGQFEIVTEPSAFDAVVEALEKAEIKTESAEVTLIPDAYVPVTDKAVASVVFKLISELDENEDVQNVHTNMDASDEVLEELEKGD